MAKASRYRMLTDDELEGKYMGPKDERYVELAALIKQLLTNEVIPKTVCSVLGPMWPERIEDLEARVVRVDGAQL